TDGEYALYPWNSNVLVVRRAKSGAVASDIYNNKIVGERSYMQDSSTRVVMFEMCGNDFLQARSSFAGQSGTCNYGVLDTALANCRPSEERAMQTTTKSATTAKVKMIANLYYPGFNADTHWSSCHDAGRGQPVTLQTLFLPYLAHSDWRACHFADQYG